MDCTKDPKLIRLLNEKHFISVKRPIFVAKRGAAFDLKKTHEPTLTDKQAKTRFQTKI